MGKLKGRRRETGHRSVRWFNHRYRKVDFSPLILFTLVFFFLQRESSTFGKRENLWGFDDEEFSINRGGDKGKQDGVFFYGFIFQIDIYLACQKLEFYIGYNR